MRTSNVSNSLVTGSGQLHPTRDTDEQSARSRLAVKVGIVAAAALLTGIAIWALKPSVAADTNPVSDGISEQDSSDPYDVLSQDPIARKYLDLKGVCFNPHSKNLIITDLQVLVQATIEYLNEFKSKAEALRLDFVKMLGIKQGDPIASQTIPYQLSQRESLALVFDYLGLGNRAHITAASQTLGEMLSSGDWIYNSKNKEWLYFSDKMFRDYKLYLIENPHLLEEGDYAKYLDVYDDVHILFPTPLADVADEAFERASRFGNVKAMRAAAHAFHKINNTIDSTPDPRERKFLEMAATHCDRQSQQDMIQITCLENNGTANKRYWDLFTGRANCTPPTVSDAAAVSSKLL